MESRTIQRKKKGLAELSNQSTQLISSIIPNSIVPYASVQIIYSLVKYSTKLLTINFQNESLNIPIWGILWLCVGREKEFFAFLIISISLKESDSIGKKR